MKNIYNVKVHSTKYSSLLKLFQRVLLLLLDILHLLFVIYCVSRRVTYYKMKEQNFTLSKQFQYIIKTRRKRQNRHPNTQIPDRRSLSLFGTGTSLKSGGVELVLNT